MKTANRIRSRAGWERRAKAENIDATWLPFSTWTKDWIGWIRNRRPGNRWVALVEGDSDEQCWTLLLAACQKIPDKHMDAAVWRNGTDPNDPR